MPYKTASKAPTRKLLAAAGGAGGVGAPLSTVIIWAFGVVAGQPLPTEVQAAIFTLVIIMVGGVAGYLTPPSAEDTPVAVPPKTPAGID